MKIKKIYNGVVPNGKILNLKSTSQNDTYSCSYINDNLSNNYDERHLIENLHFYKLDKMVFVNGLYPINAASASFKVPYKPLLTTRFPVTSSSVDETVSGSVGIGILRDDGTCSISMTGVATYAYMSFCYKTND